MCKRILSALIALALVIMPTCVFASEEYVISEFDITRIAKTLYGECRSDAIPTAEKAAVVWCILNRLDSDSYPDTIEEIVVYSQFHGYKDRHPVWDELAEIVRDVVIRWQLEKQGYAGVGRTLPEDYYYFSAGGSGNRFRKDYKSKAYWDWSLRDPYEFGFIKQIKLEDVYDEQTVI